MYLGMWKTFQELPSMAHKGLIKNVSAHVNIVMVCV
jgi:hypothetical protein